MLGAAVVLTQWNTEPAGQPLVVRQELFTGWPAGASDRTLFELDAGSVGTTAAPSSLAWQWACTEASSLAWQ